VVLWLSTLLHESIYSCHEIHPSSGSEYYHRTRKEQEDWPAETADDKTCVASASVRRPKKSASRVRAVFAGWESAGGQRGPFWLAQPVSSAGRDCL
jgi:hypothetical protein